MRDRAIEGTRPGVDTGARARRWLIGRVALVLIYVGILLDVITTAIGVGRFGRGYEQNPIGRYLIDTVGWAGLTLLLTALCLICYYSLRTVYAMRSPRWGTSINVVLVIVMVVRWIVVGTAILYIAQTRA